MPVLEAGGGVADRGSWRRWSDVGELRQVGERAASAAGLGRRHADAGEVDRRRRIHGRGHAVDGRPIGGAVVAGALRRLVGPRPRRRSSWCGGAVGGRRGAVVLGRRGPWSWLWTWVAPVSMAATLTIADRAAPGATRPMRGARPTAAPRATTTPRARPMAPSTAHTVSANCGDSASLQPVDPRDARRAGEDPAADGGDADEHDGGGGGASAAERQARARRRPAPRP